MSHNETSGLHLDEYRRYGRQMILDNFGLPGQLKLQQASVVVVGAGGLGCPALQYLAAAGVGRLGIVDHDKVEISNLARQILHSEETVGMYKSISAGQSIRKLNSRIKIDVIIEALHSSNAVSLLQSYDIILDCTDNAPTRYLLSDTAVRLGKPLVSGAAQKYEGQLCVYNFGVDGPCYRCLFPKPPAIENTGTCEETGILGPVTGIIGNMQALETIKIIVGLHDQKASMFLFSAISVPAYRAVKLRSRRKTCSACGEEDAKIGTIEETDYVAFCGGQRPNWEERGLIDDKPGFRAKVKSLKDDIDANGNVCVIDVRSPTEFGICNLPGSRNVPLYQLTANPALYLPEEKTSRIYVVCRLGNDSQIAADALRSVESDIMIQDVVGGLRAWSEQVDSKFPIY
ncbi:hypothetical protein SERLA73DRAFT_181808 [Serpula lacrymans var. lacrymans S7.3]|uniref:Rhodanese domain-containing protein n=2 Tax=Serpula lacrymans var. lacrymans TaxID=341189 RepID=F8PYS0_SERL3|nr:uncharacterized protein SERLADRAFT_468170 [Serpula lacrymans var. lacrymans S7.9]EGN99033.1 hypothetical protein SERLA73DRAFT_181808 [Serpula lacrymans var. lacrymans S7.3]EGO24608.1 hypothetical protein SERLADRAFT_468170 [Serpula lacrymans var. lacrymans S7.9]